MDNIERYIKENRKKMDIHEPDESLWGRIEKDLPARQRSIPRYLWRAATILIIIGAGLAVTVMTLLPPARQDQSPMSIVRETEQYYNSLLQSLYTEAEPVLTANPEARTELTTGMNELDSICANIRKDLRDNVATEEVVEALINNYRLRIQLLEDMLRMIREEENENENRPGYEI